MKLERVIIIDDKNFKNELDSFLSSKRNYIRFDDDMERFIKKTHILFEDFMELDEAVQKIIIETDDQRKILKTSSIIRIQRVEKKSMLFFNDGSSVLSCNPLSFLERKLSSHQFMMVHPDHLINLNSVLRIKLGEKSLLVMSNRDEVPVDKNRLQILSENLNNII